MRAGHDRKSRFEFYAKKATSQQEHQSSHHERTYRPPISVKESRDHSTSVQTDKKRYIYHTRGVCPPEIHFEVQTGKGEMNDLMVDVIKELSISAIRGSQVNINMEDFSTETKNPFPIFLRKVGVRI